MEKTIQVIEWMAEFIEWVKNLGEDEVRKMIREHLAELKEHAEATNNTRKKGEPGWDAALEPNDGNDQWKHGGDCNLCRKASYCKTQCRANKLLKKVTTPFLYQEYLTANPEAEAKIAAAKMDGMGTEQLLSTLGVKL